MSIQYFILTRFNILLWKKDKEGKRVRSIEWLEHRFDLFEHYCLPSLKSQTCQDFTWIVLFDSKTPEIFKKCIASYQTECTRLVPFYVEPENARQFASIFRSEVLKRVDEQCTHVVTTYLDNDDALNISFIEDLHCRAPGLPDGTVINYNNGYQYFERGHYLMRLCHKKNHFMSVLERVERMRTIYGYGSHSYIDRVEGIKIDYFPGKPMWCEVVHEKNMDNDAYFLRARLVKNNEILKRDFAIDATVTVRETVYLFRYLPRYSRVFVRRVKYFFFGRHW